MSAIANRYKRGDLLGVGFECDYGGVRCHAIAWENAQLERLRDHVEFTEGLIIDQCNVDVGCGLPLVINIPEPKSVHEHKQAIDAISKQLSEGQSAIVVPGGATFEEVETLKARVAELESQLAESKALVNFEDLRGEPKADGTIEVFAPIGGVDSVTEWHVDPEPAVIATHEVIEPAVTETPVEPIQEPVVEVSAPSEPTDSVPALAPDTPVAVEEVAPEVVEEVIEEAVEEAWKPTPGDSEAQTIRSYFKQFGIATPHKQVIEALSAFGIEVTSSQVLLAKKAIKQ